MSKIRKLIFDRQYRFIVFEMHGFYDSISDKMYLKKRYYSCFGKKLNLSNPLTFNEKLQWLKLHDRKPIYTDMADKFLSKKYLESVGAGELVVPLIGGPWQRFEDIDFDSLPKSFVLKTTHTSGGVFICRDKNDVDLLELSKKVNASLARNYYLHGREWPYKNINPQIIAEQYLEDDSDKVLKVYKIFNFNGEPRIIQMIRNDKTENETINYYDVDWELLDIKQNFPNGPVDKRPEQLNEMLKWARILSGDLPFVRTDFYVVNRKVYFSEFTFYSDSGFAAFEPDKWDKLLGDWLVLP